MDDGGVDGEVSPAARRVQNMGGPEVRARQSPTRGHSLRYRNWCWGCAQGHSKNKPHRARQNEKGVEDIHFDFTFLGDRSGPGRTRAGRR